MAKNKTSFQIPFNKEGDQLNFPTYNQTEWKDNFEFETTMQVTGFSPPTSI